MDDFPNVSIVIPIRNEEEYIIGCLDAIYSQSYPKSKIKVIIADGCSTDDTMMLVEKFITEHPGIPIKVINNPQKIVSTGLNKAINLSSGKIIIRVDGHCEIDHDYVSHCVQLLNDSGTDVVGGYINTEGKDSVSKAISLAMSSTFGVGGSSFRKKTGPEKFVDSVPFPGYKAEIFRSVGLFDEELIRNQDDEHNYRIRKTGRKILLSPLMRSRYYSRSTLASLFKQYFQYGFWKVRVLQKHPLQMRPRQFVPFFFFVALLLGAGIAPLFFFGKIFLMVIIIIYLFTNCVVSTLIASRQGWKYLTLLPIAYVVLHISYGLGFFVGLIKFIHRWGDKKGKVPTIE